MIVIIVFLIKLNKKEFSSLKKKYFYFYEFRFFIIFIKKLAILKSNNFIEMWKDL